LGWLLQATAIQDPRYEKIHQWSACTDWLASQMQVLTARPWQAIYTRHVIIPPNKQMGQGAITRPTSPVPE
jgi:hypothetical protein